MNEEALNQARDAAKELEIAEEKLAKDEKRQTIFGGLLIAVMLVSCLGFVAGALYVASTIGLQVKVYMDGTHDEEDH
jgi:hypothetical protein